jgi:2',3'-cyclic-nucleotide 2'-phosphodiesterase (5'-nucleotidase family)
VVAVLFGGLAASAALACSGATQNPSRAAGTGTGTVTVSIVGLNDLHGSLQALPVFGGYLDVLREARRKDGGAVLAVDAGDIFQGTLESNANEGAAAIAAYNALGLTAATIGNHELDFGPPGTDPPAIDGAAHAVIDPQGALKARIAEARFPMLAANLVDRTTGALPRWPKLERIALVEAAGVKVGLIGVLTDATPRIVMPRWFAGLGVAPLAPAVEQSARELRAKGAAVVIVLAHAGAECASFDDPRDVSSCDDGEVFQLARKLPRGLVDVIFGGHTHAGVAHLVNDVAIVEAYLSGRAFSRVDVLVDRATSKPIDRRIYRPHPLCPPPPAESCEPGSYEGQPVVPHAAASAAIQPAFVAARALREKPLGVRIESTILRSHVAESPLGNLFADLMLRAASGADVAISNGGSLRADLPPGDLSYGQLYAAMPFDNRLATLEITAADLTALLVRHLTHERHGIVSVSGLRAIGRCSTAGFTLSLTRMDGTPIPEQTRLRVVTSDYLATGGDRLFGELIASRKPDVATPLIRDAVAELLSRQGGSLRGDDRSLFDPREPRLALPTPRPVHCGGP